MERLTPCPAKGRSVVAEVESVVAVGAEPETLHYFDLDEQEVVCCLRLLQWKVWVSLPV